MKTVYWIISLVVAVAVFSAGTLAAVWGITGATEINEASRQIDTVIQNGSGLGDGFFHSVLAATPLQQQDHTALHTYTAPEGFIIKSYSDEWREDKLALLREELLKNQHGQEIETLREIVIWPQEDDQALATHSFLEEPIALQLPYGPLPEDFAIEFAYDLSVITLYGGDTNTTIESMADSLSHEYGHLYTFHYMFDTEDTVGLILGGMGQSEYARLRDSQEHKLITTMPFGNSYRDNHYRYLIEVAAEDYVQLMGSPTTRQATQYYDIRDYIQGKEYDEDGINYANNAAPQENMMLPLAYEVAGLEDYFYSFIDATPPAPAQPPAEMTLQISANSRGYDLVEGYRQFTHYTLRWNAPYTDAIYTVSCYDPEDYLIMPIRTIYPGQDTSATIGTVSYERDNYVYFSQDVICSGKRVFYVTALLPDGTYYISERLERSF